MAGDVGAGSEMSRRGFIIAAGSAAAMLAIDGCSAGGSARGRNGSDTASGSVATATTTPPRQAGQRLDVTKPEGTDLIPELEHIVVVMQENHSYDSYFGMLGRGDGFTLDPSGKPTASNADVQGARCAPFTPRVRARHTRSARTGTRRTSSGTTAPWTGSYEARAAPPRWRSLENPIRPAFTSHQFATLPAASRQAED
jgi:phospholipase C